MTYRNVIGPFLLALLLAPATVRASETFPGTLKGAWNVTKLPVKGEGCLLCHMTDPGKRTNATRPFAVTLVRNGAKGTDSGSLRGALERVRVQAVNSDGDPISDYRELAIDGTNPNDPSSYVAPVIPMPEGGAGGEGGASGAGAGGDMAVAGPYFPPGGFSGPPPFEHGCSFVARPDESRNGVFGVFGVFVLVARLTRRALRTRPNR